MSWVTVIWSMVASACLTLAAMHMVLFDEAKNAGWTVVSMKNDWKSVFRATP